MGGGDLFILDGCLVHEVFSNGDGAVFKVIGIGEDPYVTCGRLIDSDIHGERVLGMLCVFEDAVGRTSEQEHMGDLGCDCWDDVFVHQQRKAGDFIEEEYFKFEGGYDDESR